MCVIFAATAARPTREELTKANDANPDGIGIAWLDSKRGFVRWIKGLDLKQTINIVESTPFPFAVHFRYATIGGKSRESTILFMHRIFTAIFPE